MEEIGVTREEYFCSEYMRNVYYFCLKKTGNETEAEDLAGEISLEIMKMLHKGVLIEHFEGFVWKVARNRYARWVDCKRKKAENELYIQEDEKEEIPGHDNIEESAIHKEMLSKLRRELTLIEKEYREILVAYYINRESISQIANKLSIPEGTVKTKLYQGRLRLRGGFEMAREFGKLSYAPEDIEFTQVGGKSTDNVPDKFLWNELNNKICKNIMIKAYNNPSTLEELSIELGIALPYLEPFVDQMTEATILTKQGTKANKATYVTNFVIISGDARRNMVDKLSSIQRDFVRYAKEYLERARELQMANGISILGDYQDYEEQKYTLAMRLADDIQWSVYNKRNLNFNYDTKRPNGGTWDIMGNQVYVGKEFYWIGHSNGMEDGFSLNMFVTEEEANGDYDKTEVLREVRTLKRLFESGSEKLSESEAARLKSAVRKREDGTYEICFGVYQKEHNHNGLRHGVAESIYNRELLPLWDKMFELAEGYISYCEEVMRKEVPKRLMSQFNFCMQAIPYMRGMLIEGLLDCDFLKPESELSDMIGVYVEV